VKTAHSPYPDAPNEAEYRPVSAEVKPSVQTVPPKKKAQEAAPRVFEYRKQPKVQPTQKQTVTRVRHGIHQDIDEEEL
jgi:hypothetical protein